MQGNDHTFHLSRLQYRTVKTRESGLAAAGLAWAAAGGLPTVCAGADMAGGLYAGRANSLGFFDTPSSVAGGKFSFVSAAVGTDAPAPAVTGCRLSVADRLVGCVCDAAGAAGLDADG
jgi:hypothetical protein